VSDEVTTFEALRARLVELALQAPAEEQPRYHAAVDWLFAVEEGE
jgi:hypothetical protein